MQPVSEKFLPALTTDHGLEIMVSALYNGAVVRPDIAITDCSVHIDAGSDIRRTVTLTLPSPTDFPATESDPYAVYGQQLYVERGIRYTDGSVERVEVTRSSGDPRMDAAATDAARRWVYRPATVGGRPVPTSVSFPVDFPGVSRTRF